MNLRRQLFFSAVIAIIIWSLWLILLGPSLAFDIVKANWPVTITMVFGSMIAGATSEGGGAVAFPVFTKLFQIPPWDAKIFSLAIQSIGMTSASLVIVLAKIPVEWRAIRWASVGGVMGIFLGAFQFAPFFPPDITKMAFTVLTSSFAIVLLVMNRRDRLCHQQLPADGYRERMLLVAIGFAGGILSSLVGTGLDIITFSILVLLFRLSEKVATPTSVILMAINSLFGLLIFGLLQGPLKPEVFAYWMAAIPVVVIGAPIGAIACTYLSRKTIAKVLIGLISIELITSLLIIRLRWEVVGLSIVTLVCCLFAYLLMMRSQRYEPSSEPA